MIRHPDDSDNYLGYYMVESMRHFHGMYDATDRKMEEIGKMIKYLSKAIMKGTRCRPCVCIYNW